MMPPMQAHLNLLHAKAGSRFRIGVQTSFLKRQIQQVAAKLRKRGTCLETNKPGRRKSQRTCLITMRIVDTPPPVRLSLDGGGLGVAVKEIWDPAESKRKDNQKTIRSQITDLVDCTHISGSTIMIPRLLRRDCC